MDPSIVRHTKHPGRGVLLETDVSHSVLAMLAELSERTDLTDEDGVFNRPPPETGNYFTDRQRKILDAVQMQLLPEDGNGPGARELNALPYLEWAITEPANLDDGDPTFIGKGSLSLDEKSRTERGAGFVELTNELQNEVLELIAQSKFGENWLSLLMYYLTEALMLDPYYGGNPDMIGWLWLEHRPGFPRPVEGKTYRDFE